jgi:hypothetical protein
MNCNALAIIINNVFHIFCHTHTLGGTATTLTDSPATLESAVERAERHLEGLLQCLLQEEEGGSDDQGRVGRLRQFWKRILTCLVHVFLMESSVTFLVRRLSIYRPGKFSSSRARSSRGNDDQLFDNGHVG